MKDAITIDGATYVALTSRQAALHERNHLT